MKDLIERLEKATGPNFALDCAIFETVLPTEYFGSKVISWFNDGGAYGCNTEDGYRHMDCLKAPPYTGSIDAALTLRNRDDWPICQLTDLGPVMGWSCRIAVFDTGDGEINPRTHDGQAPTAPTAICIAALKAMTPPEQKDD